MAEKENAVVISAEFAEAFLSAQQEMGNPAKDHTAKIPTKSGGSFSYSYAGLDGTMDCIKTALHNHGISIAQPPVTSETGLIGVRTELIYKGGEVWDRGTLMMKGSDDPQKIGSLITYLRRYSVTSAVGVVAEDDDDGQNAQRKPVVPKPQPAPRQESMGKGFDEGPIETTPPDTFAGEDYDIPEKEEVTDGEVDASDMFLKIQQGHQLLTEKVGLEEADRILFDASKFDGKDGPIGFKGMDGVGRYANGKATETKKKKWMGSTLGKLRTAWEEME